MKLTTLALSVLLSAAPIAAAHTLAHAHQHEQKTNANHQHADKHTHDSQHKHQNEHEHQHEHDDGFTALGAHVHGQGLLTLVLEGNEMQLAFQVAAYSVLGFEQAAATVEQQQEVAAAIAVFNQGQWFSVNPQANCDMVMADASTDLLQASYAGGHADFFANYQLLCQNPARLNSISLNIFSLLPGVEKVEVEWIVNDKQGAATTTLDSNTVRF